MIQCNHAPQLPNTGVGIYDKVLEENMCRKKEATLSKEPETQLGGDTTGQVNTKSLLGYLRKDWPLKGRDGPS